MGEIFLAGLLQQDKDQWL